MSKDAPHSYTAKKRMSDPKRPRASERPTRAELLAVLKEVESVLGHSPHHNRWDLGPDSVLLLVRQILRRAGK